MSWDKAREAVAKSESGSGFLKLEDGDNRVRIVTSPHERYIHWVQAEKKSYPCIFPSSECRFCQAGEMPKSKFLFYVIDRKDGAVKLAEFGVSILKQLIKLQADEEYGFEELAPYDVVINREGSNLDTTYTVLPRTNTELTAEEKEAIDGLEPLAEVAHRLSKPKEEPVLTDAQEKEIPY